MTYRFLSPALVELTEATQYYEEKVSGLGADFIDEVNAAVDRILAFPDAWGRLSANYRHCNLRRFPYTIIENEAMHSRRLNGLASPKATTRSG